MIRTPVRGRERDSHIPPDIADLLSGEEHKTSERIVGLKRVIPILLRYAHKIEPQRAHSPTLSGFFRRNGHNVSAVEVSYFAQGGDIYAVVDDTAAGFVDAGESGTEKVSEEQFLDWVNADPLRVLDVYRHLGDYIRQKPQKPVKVPVDHF